MEDWKKIMSVDFAMNVLGVIIGLIVYNKFLKGGKF